MSQKSEKGRVEMAALCSMTSKASVEDSKGLGTGIIWKAYSLTYLVVEASYGLELEVPLHAFSPSELARASSQHSDLDPRTSIPRERENVPTRNTVLFLS